MFRKKAFTLIELLVVVAIIALLISILLPSLSGAREQAKRVKCGVQLRAIGTGTAAYMVDNNEWYPGVNTTGINFRIQLEDPANDQAEVLRNPRNPVQSWDWITPILLYDTELGLDRADRWRTAIDYYACPSNVGLRIDSTFWSGNPSDQPKIELEMRRKPYRPLSYLQPAAFQYFGESAPLIAASFSNSSNVAYLKTPPTFESIHPDFRPQLPRVGMPARKLMATDATRYLLGTGELDFDFGVHSRFFGSFGSSGGWWTGSTAYGVANGSSNWDGRPVSRGSEANGQNLALTYRHTLQRSDRPTNCQQNKGSINGLFFDGHVAAMSDRESRNIEFWYPKGQRIKQNREGMTNVPRNFRVP